MHQPNFRPTAAMVSKLTVYRRDGAYLSKTAFLDTYLFKRRSLSVVNNKTTGEGIQKDCQIITMVVYTNKIATLLNSSNVYLLKLKRCSQTNY